MGRILCRLGGAGGRCTEGDREVVAVVVVVVVVVMLGLMTATEGVIGDSISGTG